jgi:hypothetical protein
MSTPDPAADRSPEPAPPPGLPPAPWILLDRTIVEQAAVVFERLEEWLAGADPQATADCAHACSLGEADEVEVAAWLGTLAANLHQRIQASDPDGLDPDGREEGVDPWS